MFVISDLESSSAVCDAAFANGINILIKPNIGSIIVVSDSMRPASISSNVSSSSSSNNNEFSSSSISFSKTSDSS